MVVERRNDQETDEGHQAVEDGLGDQEHNEQAVTNDYINLIANTYAALERPIKTHDGVRTLSRQRGSGGLFYNPP